MKVVSFVNMKGGVAKTTLAVNVADCLVRRHDLRVLLIDTDPQFNATQCLISGEDYVDNCRSGRHTILNIFDDSTRPVVGSVDGASVQHPVKFDSVEPWKINDGLDIIPGALELFRLDVGGGQGREIRLKRYIEHVSQNYGYNVIVIDTPPTPSAWMASALIASDYYVIPVKPEPLSATGIDLLRAVVNRVKENYALNIECGGVVLTIAEKNTIVYRDAVDFIDNNRYWKGKRYLYSLPKRTIVARMQGNQGLILDSRDIALKRSVSEITKEFIDRMEIEE
jgi:chromosome partitioning protein